MSEPFGAAYARAYDLLYRDKPYDDEVEEALGLAKAAGVASVRRVLDLGCGTGGHSLALASRGLEVVGVDRSAAMLAHAKGKVAHAGHADRIRLVQADLAEERGDESKEMEPGGFDVALLMFAVLGYLTDDNAAVAALQTAARALKPGGVVVFDAWYGPAVLTQRPGAREREIVYDGALVRRKTASTLHVEQQVVEVAFELRLEEASGEVHEVQETHPVRFFFPRELALLCQVAGLELVRLAPAGAADRPITEDDWNFIAVAKKA